MVLTHDDVDTVLMCALGEELRAEIAAADTMPAPRAFRLEIMLDGAWVVARRDGEIATFASREEAECEARWSFDAGAEWRVVEVAS